MAGAWPYRQIGIVGAGRVATALGLALADKSVEPVRIWGRDPARCAATVAAIDHGRATSDIAEVAGNCDLIVLAVSDDALAPTIRTFAASAQTAATAGAAPPFVFHVSGSSGGAVLEPLRACGWRTAAIHPAMTFTGEPKAEVQRMIGARFAVTGSTPDTGMEARAIVEHLGGVPVAIAEEHRPLYHAALCHGANHLVTLIAGACEALAAAGADDPAALLAPLARAALENALSKGLAGLSGPLLRGDEMTIEGHIGSLKANSLPMLAPYRAMALATLDALERHSDVASSALLRSVLQRDR